MKKKRFIVVFVAVSHVGMHTRYAAQNNKQSDYMSPELYVNRTALVKGIVFGKQDARRRTGLFTSSPDTT